MFKRLLQIIVLGSAVTTATLAYADNAKTGCAMKAEKIQQQIEYAKAHGNTNRQAGLERALARVNERCTDDYLRTELETKVTKQQHKVDEYQTELTEAKADGNTKKIAKRQKKLEKAQQDLAAAKQELNSYFK